MNRWEIVTVSADSHVFISSTYDLNLKTESSKLVTASNKQRRLIIYQKKLAQKVSANDGRKKDTERHNKIVYTTP